MSSAAAIPSAPQWQSHLLYVNPNNRMDAEAEIRQAGGRVSHHLGPDVVVAQLPSNSEIDPATFRHSSVELPPHLDPTSRALRDAWVALQNKRVARSNAPLEPSVAWDSANHDAPRYRGTTGQDSEE
jgi:hypothetical protein